MFLQNRITMNFIPSIKLFSTGIILSICMLMSVNSFASGSQPTKAGHIAEPIFSGNVYLEQWGDKSNPAIVLVHGIGHEGARSWQKLAPLLSKKFHVVTFDLPGFGRSSRLNQLYSPDNYARFIDWVAENYVKKRFILIGHSMGGAISLNYAAIYAEKVKQLILVDAAGVLHRSAFSKSLINNFKPTWWSHLIPSTEEFSQLLGFSLEDFDKFPLALNLVLAMPLTRNQFLGGDPLRIAGMALVQHDFSGQFEQVTMPTLIIWGGRDTIAPLRTGKMLTGLLPNAQLEIIRDAKHVPMLETTDTFNKIVWDRVTNKSKLIPSIRKNSLTASGNNKRNDSCHQQQERYYTGRYKRLILDACDRITIENAKIDYLEVKHSSVEIFNSEIGAGEKALIVNNSIVFATASKFEADVPIVVNKSRLDFAGVEIIANEQAFKSQMKSTIIFSVSKIKSPQQTGSLHGVHTFAATEQAL